MTHAQVSFVSVTMLKNSFLTFEDEKERKWLYMHTQFVLIDLCIFLVTKHFSAVSGLSCMYLRAQLIVME